MFGSGCLTTAFSKVEWIQSHCLQAWEQDSCGTAHEKQGLGSGRSGLNWHVVLIAAVEWVIIVYWCFNWPGPRTWADENHMLQCDCVHGLVKDGAPAEERPPDHTATQRRLCMLKTSLFFFYPPSWLMQRGTTSTWRAFPLTQGFGSWFMLQCCCWDETRGVGLCYFKSPPWLPAEIREEWELLRYRIHTDEWLSRGAKRCFTEPPLV